jgi:hypothetical protein
VVNLDVVPQLDQESAKQVAATLRGILAEAIRGALIDVAVGTVNEPEGEPLSDDEAELLDHYRRCTDAHRIAARRTLDRGLPAKGDD